MMITQMRKTAALIFIPCLLLWSTALASLAGKDFNIPAQYGSIKEIFETASAKANAVPTIIHIQDAHCNYEAQKNMAQLLDYLVKTQGLKLIMVEGGTGDVSLSFLRAYSDQKARVDVADKYLKEGRISGEEYLDIISDYPLELYGIEDEALYDAHLAAFGKVDSLREKGLKDVEALSRIIEALKPYLYSDQLRQLGEKKAAYENTALSLIDYCNYLNGMADKKSLSLKDYPHLAAFVEIARLENEIDFKQAEAERNLFIKELASLLDEQAVKELIQKTEDFKAKKITAQQYYSLLKSLAEGKIDLSSNYPHLNSYIRYLAVSRDIDAIALLKEVNSVSDALKEEFFTTSEQRRLSEINKSSELLRHALNLELTPEDYGYFKENKPKFLTSSWIDFLTQNCGKYNLAMQPSVSTVIDENLQELDGFYQLGASREQAFFKNMVNKIGESNAKTVALITGGFHTPGITKMLKDKGYSYLVVSPAITKKGDSSLYFSVLRGEKNRPQEDFDIQESFNISDVQGEEEY